MLINYQTVYIYINLKIIYIATLPCSKLIVYFLPSFFLSFLNNSDKEPLANSSKERERPGRCGGEGGLQVEEWCTGIGKLNK